MALNAYDYLQLSVNIQSKFFFGVFCGVRCGVGRGVLVAIIVDCGRGVAFLVGRGVGFLVEAGCTVSSGLGVWEI